MSKIVTLGAALCLVGCAAAAQPQPGRSLAIPPSASCEALGRAAVPDRTTVITSAVLRPAGPLPSGPPRPGLPPGARPAPPQIAPAHCELFGKLQERQGANGQTYAIKFHLRLPSAWNGRFFFQGGGGTNGNIGEALGALPGQGGTGLELGYAVVTQDAGHDNAVNTDPMLQGVATFGWDAEARHNHGFASIGPVVRTGKALIAAYYGRGPELTYFVGGSKGGQEAMMAVQRFPDDFEAAIIGYPGFRLAYAGAVGQLWDGQAFAKAARAMGKVGADGLPLANKAMSDDDLVVASNAILSACDELDGTKDGMVENPTACTDQRVLPTLAAVTCKADKTQSCLLPVQVAALRKIYGGARGRDGKPLYSDWPWDPGIGARTGRGVTQGWRQWKLGAYAPDANNGNLIRLGAPSGSALFTSPPTPVADDVASLARYAFTVNIEDNYRKAQVKWGAFNESAVDYMNAESTDLRRFVSRGGKIIIYHGAADPVFSMNDTLRWLKAVDAREGGRASRFIRFYVVPGMNHGRGGPATDRFDVFSPLVAWREHGVEPASIIATAGDDTPWPGRTRLLCPYPQQPRRTGADIETAASFHCANP